MNSTLREYEVRGALTVFSERLTEVKRILTLSPSRAELYIAGWAASPGRGRTVGIAPTNPTELRARRRTQCHNWREAPRPESSDAR
jgi:hypothetical protein